MAEPLVLCYHAVSETWDADLSVTPDALREQLRLLVDRGYRGATFSEAAAGRAGSKTVVVTFDDGYRSVVERALPILAELSLPGTVFVVTDFVSREVPMSWDGISRWQGGEHEAELPSLSWDDARSLREAGWEIGSHTCSHPRLTRLPDDRLARELAESKERCEANLGSCLSLAYPYGDHDGRVVAAAEGAGYRFACTLPDRLPAAAPLAWPRIGIYHGDTPGGFRRKVSPRLLRLRRSSLWPVVLSTRRRLSAARSRR